MLHQFPFRILGFPADNGSEYINRTGAQLLNKLLAEFTKSRADKSQDNALVEGKNGAVIRKHIGWGHIASPHAEALQKFYTAQFNPYLNYHRPCGFATVTTAANGKRQRRYPAADYATPYQKLKSLEQAATFLKPALSFAQLDRLASALSDTECAQKMTRAKVQLLRRIKLESPVPLRFRDLFLRAGAGGTGASNTGPLPLHPHPPLKKGGLQPRNLQDHLVLKSTPPSGSSLDWKMLQRHA